MFIKVKIFLLVVKWFIVWLDVPVLTPEKLLRLIIIKVFGAGENEIYLV